jgi:hypothetical protein
LAEYGNVSPRRHQLYGHSTLGLTERVGLQSWVNDFTAISQTFPHARISF